MAVAEIASRGAFQHGPLNHREIDVERNEDVPKLDCAAEARDRARWPARRAIGGRGLSGALA
jgi:hypothetical protein